FESPPKIASAPAATPAVGYAMTSPFAPATSQMTYGEQREYSSIHGLEEDIIP
uniref:Uncharacterized protein n=1 Tax=Plectus sambesii TaxID=2011161 RepID=A0A914VSD7_9BILA